MEASVSSFADIWCCPLAAWLQSMVVSTHGYTQPGSPAALMRVGVAGASPIPHHATSWPRCASRTPTSRTTCAAPV